MTEATQIGLSKKIEIICSAPEHYISAKKQNKKTSNQTAHSHFADYL